MTGSFSQGYSNGYDIGSGGEPGDLCYCFFNFPNELAGLLDPVIGPLLGEGASGGGFSDGFSITTTAIISSGSIFPLSVYDTLNPDPNKRKSPWDGSVDYLQQWWCMVVLTFPLNAAITNHPNLELILDWQLGPRTGYRPYEGGTVVVQNNMTADRLLTMEIISPYGSVLLPGTH
jgi:hypothetical protein